jgi:hypothetical protein
MDQEEIIEYLNKDIQNLKSLNFNQDYIKETTENTAKWAKLGFLRNIDDPYIGRNVALLLENQRLFFEEVKPPIIKEGAITEISVGYWWNQWKRVSISIIRRTFGEKFVGHDLVSVQPINRPSGQSLYLTGLDGKTNIFISTAKTRFLPFSWEHPTFEEHGGTIFQGRKYQMGIDAEAEASAVFSEKLRDEFSREIIRDLANNAGKSVVYNYESESQLLTLIEGMSSYIAAKCQNKDATWVVTSSAIVDLLSEYIEFYPEVTRGEEGVQKIGLLNKKWAIIEDCNAPSGNILMGLKDNRNHYFSGYVYSPYRPVLPVLAWKKGEQEEKAHAFTRYDKKLINADFYGTIKIEDLPTQLEKVVDLKNKTEEEVENGV